MQKQSVKGHHFARPLMWKFTTFRTLGTSNTHAHQLRPGTKVATAGMGCFGA
jgi:hypothetical protein